ncbi:hypothetical protein [Pelotomaculum propionicicum]|uniref:Uncharacterized protein n=1 Tax=Pelotomaculum propionicicum TaxID=258475 RepID=A0A4Y7RQW0_9FIRM|nr:hypothetical protein [Pelotomaculum propionicicum]TEB10647.1 hypothetical protein Pmgp_02227 [Pelotomaculum propionicicum]
MKNKMTKHLKLATVIAVLATAADFTQAGLDEDAKKTLKYSLCSIFFEHFIDCADNDTEIPEESIEQAYEILEGFLGSPMNWFFS